MLNDINTQALKIWDTAEINSEFLEYLPYFYDPQIEQRSLLFVGINPSFSVGGYKRYLKNTPYSSFDPEIFYKRRSITSKQIEQSLNTEKYMVSVYPFYKPFRDIAQEAFGDGEDWNHVDLLFIRNKNQKIIEEMFKQAEIDTSLDWFLKKQMTLSKSLIEILNPKIIVVANAYASKLLSSDRFFGTRLKWDSTNGWYLLDAKIPVFFSSMIAQGRMDKWSFQRLRWHISKAKDICRP